MPVVADQVIVELEARVAKYQRDVNNAVRRFDAGMKRIETSAQRAERQTERAMSRAGNAVRTAVSGIVAALGTREIVRYGDAWTEAGNKLAAAAQISGIQVATLSDLADGAIEARTAFEPYVDLYARINRAAGSLNATQEQVSRATETVSKAFVAGGATAQEAASGILQLGQALASGELLGEELRAIRENAPLVARAIADEFDTTIGGLKELGQEGALTADRVLKAILNGQSEIEAAFATTNATIGDSFNNVRTALIRFIGDADDTVGATEALAAALNTLANNLDIVAAAATALALRGLVPLIVGFASRLAPAVRTAATALQLLAVQGGASLVAIQALRGAVGLLGGPVGVALTVVAGLAFAFTQLGDGAASAAEGINGLRQALAAVEGTMSKLGGVNRALEQDTDRLEKANRALEDAMRDGEAAAISLAASEVEAIRDRIAANERLKDVYAELLQAQAVQLQAQREIASRSLLAEFSDVPRSVSTPGPGVAGGTSRRLAPGERIERQQQQVDSLRRSIDQLGDVGEASDRQLRFIEANAALTELDTRAQIALDAAQRINDLAVETPDDSNITAGGGAGGAGAGAGASRDSLNALEKEIAAIEERSSVMRAMIGVQSELNPFLDDYAIALEAAATQQELLNAAEEAGVQVTPELSQKIADLAAGYAQLARQADLTDQFSRSVEGIQEAIAELEVEANILREINPLIEDFGFQQARAEVEQTLLNEAIRAGVPITDQLREAIARLADEYGRATAESGKLTDQQERAKDAAETASDTFKSAFRGIVDDIRDGENALDTFANALDAIASKLANLALDNLFSQQGLGGGIGGFLGPLFTSFAAKGGVFAAGRELPRFQSGGVSNRAAIFAEAGTEAAVPLPDGRRIPVDLRVPELQLPRQVERSGDQIVHLGGLHVHGVSSVDEFNRSRPQLMAGLRRDLDRVTDRNTA